VDGRKLRRQQNRDAAVAALLELYREGRYDATAADVAERAGLSPRSLFRYFDDTDDLARAAIEHEQARGRKLLVLGVGPEDPLEERIAAVVESRIRLWDVLGPAAQAARMRAPVTPVVAQELRRNRSYLRRQLQELFAPELAPNRHDLLAALDVLCSFEAYDLLRHDHRLSHARVSAVMTTALRGLLGSTGGSP
jgi:AcrR family transcriptional regulator